jgi:hypothetical protein
VRVSASWVCSRASSNPSNRAARLPLLLRYFHRWCGNCCKPQSFGRIWPKITRLAGSSGSIRHLWHSRPIQPIYRSRRKRSIQQKAPPPVFRAEIGSFDLGGARPSSRGLPPPPKTPIWCRCLDLDCLRCALPVFRRYTTYFPRHSRSPREYQCASPPPPQRTIRIDNHASCIVV